MASHVGNVRSHNEDSVWATGFDIGSKLAVRTGTMPSHGSAALLADGMGGHAAGDVASYLAVELLRPVASSLLSRTAVAQAMTATNEGLFKAMDIDPDLFAMGTTIVGVAFASGEACVFNVGDSRAYLHCKDGLVRLSVDHVEDGNVLTQCLGGFEREVVEPSCRIIPLTGPCRLLLCSDGLTDMVADDQIAAILADKQVEAGSALLKAALSAGGHDNVSVIVIDVESLQPAATS